MDLLVDSGLVVTMDRERRILPDTSVAVAGGCIVGVGQPAELVQAHGAPGEVLDARGLVVTPGLINAHTHLFQCFHRGLGDGLAFTTWHKAVVWQSYQYMDLEDIYVFTLLGCLENIRTGATCAVSIQASPNSPASYRRAAEALRAAGLRGVVVKNFNVPADAGGAQADSALAECREVLDALHGTADGRLAVWLGPSTAADAPGPVIQAAHRLARAYGAGLHTHVQESAELAAATHARLGMSEVEFLHGLGVLDEYFHGAHCVGISPRDIELLGAARANVMHCPVSNLYLGSGVAPVPELLAAGCTICLGSDGPASNNNQDMLATLKLASLLPKGLRLDPSLVPPGQALEWATLSGGRALGRRDLGCIEAGARADLAIWDLKSTFTAPAHRPVSALVYSAVPSCLRHLLVDGVPLCRGGQMTRVDEEEVVREALMRAGHLLRRSGLDVRAQGTWPWV